MLNFISPRDHSAWIHSSREEIRSNSKGLMSQICDKDREFYGGVKGNNGSFKCVVNTESTHTSPRSKDQEQFKPMRKHDKVRAQKDEFEKILRIEQELSESIELCQVSKV